MILEVFSNPSNSGILCQEQFWGTPTVELLWALWVPVQTSPGLSPWAAVSPGSGQRLSLCHILPCNAAQAVPAASAAADSPENELDLV